MEGSARELLADVEPEGDDSELNAAAQFLRETLADGKMLQKDVEREYKSAGYKKATVVRAKKRLGIASKKEGKTGPWYWSLPAENPEDAEENPEGAQDAHQNSVSTFRKYEHLQENPLDNTDCVEVEI